MCAAKYNFSRSINQVSQDGVMREVILLEEKAQKSWERKWGYLKETKRMFLDKEKEEGCNYDLKDKQRLNSWKQAECPFPIPPSPPVPQTSQGIIGWRAIYGEGSLNKVGPLYVSPKHTIVHSPNINPKEQYHIFLG